MEGGGREGRREEGGTRREGRRKSRAARFPRSSSAQSSEFKTKRSGDVGRGICATRQTGSLEGPREREQQPREKADGSVDMEDGRR